MSHAQTLRAAAKAAAALKRSSKKEEFVPPPNITEIQRYKEFQKILCFIVVCAVYGSGVICRVEGKYEKVHEAFNKILPSYFFT
jgi:hypothetical protein